MDVSVLAAFGAGLLSFFSPCVLPLIPGYICFITGLSIEDLTAPGSKGAGNKSFILTGTILFILGFSVIFVGLGASATFLGSFLYEYQSLIRVVGGLVVVLFGLHIAGLFNIRFLQYEKRLHLKGRPAGALTPFLLGMAFGFGWAPCVGPILGSILMLAATRDSVGQGILLLSFYSFGLALPFLLVSVGIGRALALFSGIKRHFRVISLVSGALLIIIGIGMVITGIVTIPGR